MRKQQPGPTEEGQEARTAWPEPIPEKQPAGGGGEDRIILPIPMQGNGRRVNPDSRGGQTPSRQRIEKLQTMGKGHVNGFTEASLHQDLKQSHLGT